MQEVTGMLHHENNKNEVHSGEDGVKEKLA